MCHRSQCSLLDVLIEIIEQMELAKTKTSLILVNSNVLSTQRDQVMVSSTCSINEIVTAIISKLMVFKGEEIKILLNEEWVVY